MDVLSVEFHIWYVRVHDFPPSHKLNNLFDLKVGKQWYYDAWVLYMSILMICHFLDILNIYQIYKLIIQVQF